MGTRYGIDTYVNKVIFNYFNKQEMFKRYNSQIKDIAVHSIEVPIEKAVDKIIMIVEQKIDYDKTYYIVDRCAKKYSQHIEAFKDYFINNQTYSDVAKKYGYSIRTLLYKVRDFREDVESKLKASGVEYEK